MIGLGILGAMFYSRQLTILSLNEEVAVGLGQNTGRIKVILLVITIVLAGVAVSLAGNLAFVGLLVPHIVRAIVETDYRLVIPSAAIYRCYFPITGGYAGTDAPCSI